MKKFRFHLNEEQEHHHNLIPGRMNPPHQGHEMGVNQTIAHREKTGGTQSIFVTRTSGDVKNPLTPEQKEKHVKKAFPNSQVEIAKPDSPTLLHHLSELHSRGVTHLHVHAGSDRVPQYQELIKKYNGVEGRHGYYKFKDIQVHGVGGERTDDDHGVASASATKMRASAAAGDREAFHAMAPSAMSTKDKDSMMSDVQNGLRNAIKPKKKLKEDTSTGSVGGLGFNTGNPASDDVNTLSYVGINSLESDKENGNLVKMIQSLHLNHHSGLFKTLSSHHQDILSHRRKPYKYK
jgi:hypothetical protein